MSDAPEGTTFKGTAVVTIVVEMEISGDTTTGDVQALRKEFAESARQAVANCVNDSLKVGDKSYWHRKPGTVQATAVKLTIDWEATAAK